MKRAFTVLLMILGGLSLLKGQSYDTVSIKEIQKVAQADLANCIDSSSYNGDTVVVKGTVVMDGNLSRIMGAESRNVWIQNGKGPWSGIDVFGFTSSTSPVDIQNLVAGDSVMITGQITEFEGESEIVPLTGSGVESVHLINSGNKVQNTDVDISQLNDKNQNNLLTKGEKYEGAFVTIRNVTVVSVQNFGNGRVSFDIENSNGNRMNVSDQFLAQRTPQNDTAGSFEAPTVGTSIDSIKGVITHAKNDCPGFDSRGYELNPFDSSHYNYGPAPPRIVDINVNPVVPSSSQKATIKANVTDRNGIDNVSLYYAAGLNNNNYKQVNMSNTSGDTYEGQIPAQNNKTWVKFYIEATDQDNPKMTNTIPNVPNNDKPRVYKVKNSSLTVYDIQYTPFLGSPYFSDESPYVNKRVTLNGVVTSASEGQSNNINAVFIQQKGKLGWGGIQVTQNSQLKNLNVGDQVELTGTVRENFGMTVISNVANISKKGKTEPEAVPVHPSTFSSGDPNSNNEPYEGMLINLSSDTSKLYVVDSNPDAPSNFGEYRVGTDTFDPNSGTRILAGRNTDQVFSSNHVSYINSQQWATQAEALKVKPKPVSVGNSMDSLKGILIYSFSNYKALPRSNDDFFNYSDSVTDSDDTSGSRNAQLSANQPIQVYPNPTEGPIQLKIEDQFSKGPFKVAIINMDGEVLHKPSKDKSLNTGATMDLSHLNPGVYIIKAEAGDKKYYRKILIR